MISWRRAVITPAGCRWLVAVGKATPRYDPGEHTKRVPDNQSQLRDLLALLAELHERGFTTGGIQEFRHPDEDLAILLADATVHDRDSICETLSIHAGDAPSTLRRVRGAVATHSKAAIVLLLRGSSSGLNLCLLLSDQGGVLVLVLRVRLALVVLLLLLLLLVVLQPRGISLGVLMLVGEDVLALRLEHGER